MVKYSPKEKSYGEMYLVMKFEKDIMENSLQKLRNNKKDLTDKSVTTNDPSKSKNDPLLSPSSFQSALGTDKNPSKKIKKRSGSEKTKIP